MPSVTRLHAAPRSSGINIHGDTIYLSGQVADRAQGKSVKEQTRDILARIDELLAEVGSNKSKILSVTIFLADMNTFDEMNSVWDPWVAKNNAPGRATVEGKLAFPHFAVEMCVIAAK